MRPLRYLITLLLLLVVDFCAAARSSSTYPSLSDSIETVSLLTCAPGSEVYELEGHSALRIRHDGQDYVVNWGLFDFDSPNFLYRFVKGQTDYSVGVEPTPMFFARYERDGRPITEQVLNLTPDQVERVAELVDINLRPENRVYRYNYVYDNCATRPMAIISAAIGQPIEYRRPMFSPISQPTFRKLMTYYHRNHPWYQFGIDLALGSGIDKPLKPSDEIFAPVRLEQLLATTDLVSDTYTTDTPSIDAKPTPWFLTPLAVSILLLLTTLALTYFDLRRGLMSRGFDVALYTIYGLMGCVIAFLVFASEHEATSPNFNLLWLNPLLLFVPIALYIPRLHKALRYFLWIYIVAALLFPAVYSIQSYNVAFIPMILTIVVRSFFIRHYTTPRS